MVKKTNKLLKFLKILTNICFFVATLSYPFAVFYGEICGLNLTLICGFMAVVWTLKAFFQKSKFSLFCAAFFAFNALFHNKTLVLFYPSIVNFSLFFAFLWTLKGEAMITKFAKMQEPNLNKKDIIYTRKLTLVWCGMFIFNGSTALFLSFFDERLWAVFSGVVSYIFVGVLFFGELIYRKFIRK